MIASVPPSSFRRKRCTSVPFVFPAPSARHKQCCHAAMQSEHLALMAGRWSTAALFDQPSLQFLAVGQESAQCHRVRAIRKHDWQIRFRAPQHFADRSVSKLVHCFANRLVSLLTKWSACSPDGFFANGFHTLLTAFSKVDFQQQNSALFCSRDSVLLRGLKLCWRKMRFAHGTVTSLKDPSAHCR